MPYANNKGADQPAHPRSLISTFIVRYLELIPIIAKSKISRLQLVSVAEQAGLCLPWSQIPEVTFSRDGAQIILEMHQPRIKIPLSWWSSEQLAGLEVGNDIRMYMY